MQHHSCGFVRNHKEIFPTYQRIFRCLKTATDRPPRNSCAQMTPSGVSLRKGFVHYLRAGSEELADGTFDGRRRKINEPVFCSDA